VRRATHHGLRFGWTDEQLELRAKRPHSLARFSTRAADDRDGRFPVEKWDKLASRGFFGLSVPSGPGGAGLAGVESYYQAGRDPRWNRYHVGFLLLAHAIQQAACDSMTEYRLLRGGEPYKYRFATTDPGLETVGVPMVPWPGSGCPC
jgi:alkylation response protein AidB-like acyl-CoA dehydrogenase